jgi:hypothetical protein
VRCSAAAEHLSLPGALLSDIAGHFHCGNALSSNQDALVINADKRGTPA